MRLDTKLKGSLRLMRRRGRPQLFITRAEDSTSALARALSLLGSVDFQCGGWCFQRCVGGDALLRRAPGACTALP